VVLARAVCRHLDLHIKKSSEVPWRDDVVARLRVGRGVDPRRAAAFPFKFRFFFPSIHKFLVTLSSGHQSAELTQGAFGWFSD